MGEGRQLINIFTQKNERGILLLAAIILLLGSQSCVPLDNYGYPKHVFLAKQGETIEIGGEESFHSFDILNYDGEGTHMNDGSITSDTITLTNDWLTVKTTRFNNRLTIIAKPNTTGKSRTLYVGLMIDDSLADIQVKQH